MNQSTDPVKPILILGAHGQLGQAFQQILRNQPLPLKFASRKEADFTQGEDTLRFVDSVQPKLIINAAAYTAVDRAESEPEIAYLVNAKTPGQLAHWCSQNRVPLVHYSTDYVFSGEGTIPWKESDPPLPQNIYGKTKAQGEKLIEEAGGEYLIFRTSWIYDGRGKNFLRTMLRLARNQDTLKVVNDQFGAPTSALDLATYSWQAVQIALKSSLFPSGIYHLCSQGETTWFDFAKAIFEEASKQGMLFQMKNLVPITTSEFPTSAKRPLNSRLNTNKLYDQFQIKLPYWRESLSHILTNHLDSLP